MHNLQTKKSFVNNSTNYNYYYYTPSKKLYNIDSAVFLYSNLLKKNADVQQKN